MPDESSRVTGYALTHGEHQVFGGPENGGWDEVIPREVLEAAVAQRPSVPVKLGGPDGPVIGEATLSVDDVGLKMDADLDWGVAFRVKKQDWSGDSTNRTLGAMDLEYSYVVPRPAQPEDKS